MPFHRYVIGHPGFWERVGWFLPLVVFALLLALAAFAVVRLIERGAHPSGPPPPSHGGADAALNQVRYRYASGQLSREEYFRLMADLGGAPPYAAAPPPPPVPAAVPSPTPAAGAPPAGPLEE